MPTILVVDDEEAIRLILCELLTPRFDCHVADSVEQATLRLDEDSYDLVVTDIAMPGDSGIELLSRIRRCQPETPVIVISGACHDQHTAELGKLGAFGFISKPFDFGELLEMVDRAVEVRQRHSPNLPTDVLSVSHAAMADDAGAGAKHIDLLWTEAFRRNEPLPHGTIN